MLPPASISIDGPVRAKNGEALYLAVCRVPRADRYGFATVKLGMRVRPGSWLANRLQRRLPTLQALCLGDVIHVPSSVRISKALLQHEAMHVWQFMARCRGSLTAYLFGYFYLLVRHGYARHPWEREARHAAHGFRFDTPPA